MTTCPAPPCAVPTMPAVTIHPRERAQNLVRRVPLLFERPARFDPETPVRAALRARHRARVEREAREHEWLRLWANGPLS